MNLPLNQVVCGEVREVLRKFPSESIDLVITSPPYWGLRDYGLPPTVWGGDPDCKHEWASSKRYWDNRHASVLAREGKDELGSRKDARGYLTDSFCVKCGAWRGQLGLEPHPQMYIDHLVEVCREIKRVLKPSGSFYLNLGDTYYGKHGSPYEGEKWIDKKLPARANPKRRNEQKKSEWLQPKQLLLIPSRVAIALQEDGWILRNDICLDGQTMLVAKVDGKLWKGTLKDLSELSNKDICLPTSNKGKSIWVKVKRIWKSSERTRFKITLTNGLSVIASPNHRFPIKTSKCRAKKYIKMRVNQVANIRIGEHLPTHDNFSFS